MLKPAPIPNHNLGLYEFKLESFKNILLALLGQNQLTQGEFCQLYQLIRHFSGLFEVVPSLQPHVNNTCLIQWPVQEDIIGDIDFLNARLEIQTKFRAWLGTLVRLAGHER